MANAELPIRYAERASDIKSAASQVNLRWLSLRPANYDISVSDTRAKTGSESLQYSLLSGESSCYSLDTIWTNSNLLNFCHREATRNKWVSSVLDPASQFCDFDEIYTVSD